MTDKKTPEMPWPKVYILSSDYRLPKDNPLLVASWYCDVGHKDALLCAIIPEAEALELWKMKQGILDTVARSVAACNERDRLSEALGVAKEALGKCRDLPMPLFIDGVMVSTQALARIEEIMKC